MLTTFGRRGEVVIQKLSELHDGVGVGPVGDVFESDDSDADLPGGRKSGQISGAGLEPRAPRHVVT